MSDSIQRLRVRLDADGDADRDNMEYVDDVVEDVLGAEMDVKAQFVKSLQQAKTPTVNPFDSSTTWIATGVGAAVGILGGVLLSKRRGRGAFIGGLVGAPVGFAAGWGISQWRTNTAWENLRNAAKTMSVS